MRILVTGATGFVGGHLVPALVRDHHEVIAATRSLGTAPQGSSEVVVGDIGASTEWTHALEGVEAVVHLAARVHVLNERSTDPLHAYRAVNTDGTVRLARAAVGAGVRRFVFLSTIKVNGEATQGVPFHRHSAPVPLDPYGHSKLEAEAKLRELAESEDMDVISLRPTVVYGAGVGGNVRRIARAVQRGAPLPLGAIKNRRTMLAIDNLLTAIKAALTIDPVPSDAILLGDQEPVSTRQLVRYLAEGMGRPARLVPVPVSALIAGGAALGKRREIQRLVQDLEVDGDWDALGVSPEVLVTPRTALVALGRDLALGGAG